MNKEEFAKLHAISIEALEQIEHIKKLLRALTCSVDYIEKEVIKECIDRVYAHAIPGSDDVH
jgi:hypothetical protein